MTTGQALFVMMDWANARRLVVVAVVISFCGAHLLR